MSKRGTGAVFFAIAAFLFAARYIAAAIFMSGLPSHNAELFAAGLQYVGGTLTTLSTISLVVGILYLVWGEIESLVSRKD
jgi:hypothetical protein